MSIRRRLFSSAALKSRATIIFGSNTDVGKTIVSAGLVRASRERNVHYIKPLQCGGSDQAFIEQHAPHVKAQTLFRWETPASPHVASIRENSPTSDKEVLDALNKALMEISNSGTSTEGAAAAINGAHTTEATSDSTPSDAELIETLHEVVHAFEGAHKEAAGDPASQKEIMHALTSVLGDTSGTTTDEEELVSALNAMERKPPRPSTTTVWIETAGGILSPSSASPLNKLAAHATCTNGWGWTTQADLYQPYVETTPVVLVGDGRLGGISATLSSMESLMTRGYMIHGIVLIGSSEHDNVLALREYASRQVTPSQNGSTELFRLDPESSIVSLPELPPESEPLDEWFASTQLEATFEAFNEHLEETWSESY